MWATHTYIIYIYIYIYIYIERDIYGKMGIFAKKKYSAAISDELSQWWADCSCSDEAYDHTAGGLTNTGSNKERKIKDRTTS